MAEPGGTLRLFFALWPDAAVRRAIEASTAGAVAASGGRPVPRANYHLTLVFLGDQPAAVLPAIRGAADRVAPPAGLLRLERLGTFPRAGVLWLGPSRTPPALARCVGDLRAALAAAGVEWPAEPPRFRPHLTLARRIRRRQPAAASTPVPWRYAGLSLVASERARAPYRVLANWPCPGAPRVK